MLVTTSPGLMAWSPGMFSQVGTMTTRLSLGLSSATARSVPSTLAAPPMSNFISSISAAGLMEMPPVSKVMPLPTSTIGACVFACTVVLRDDEARRLGRALRHGEEGAHAELLDRLAVEHLDLQAELLAELLRLLAQVGRRAVVAGTVGELARQRHAGGDGLAARQALGDRLGRGLARTAASPAAARRLPVRSAWCGGTRRWRRSRPRPAPRRARHRFRRRRTAPPRHAWRRRP